MHCLLTYFDLINILNLILHLFAAALFKFYDNEETMDAEKESELEEGIDKNLIFDRDAVDLLRLGNFDGAIL